MNRRNFLAFIPTLSAIPFIGTDIIQKPDKIEIIKPEAFNAKEESDYEIFDFSKCEIQIVQNGKIMGRGYLTELSIDAPFNEGGSEHFSPYREIRVSGLLNDIKYS